MEHIQSADSAEDLQGAIAMTIQIMRLAEAEVLDVLPRRPQVVRLIRRRHLEKSQ